jgi:hypothetical protein
LTASAACGPGSSAAPCICIKTPPLQDRSIVGKPNEEWRVASQIEFVPAKPVKEKTCGA